MSSTHYGLQRQCSARVTRRSASVEKPPQGRHFHLAGVIMLINVGGAATEESTAAAAAGQTPGKTVAIAAGASTSTDFPNGQSGTGRLSFRLRRLLRNAKHPDCQCSLRYYMKFRCRGCSLKQSTGLFLYRSRGVETRSLLRKNCRELRHSSATLRDGYVLIRQFSLRITETRPCYAPDPTGENIDSATISEMRRKYL